MSFFQKDSLTEDKKPGIALCVCVCVHICVAGVCVCVCVCKQWSDLLLSQIKNRTPFWYWTLFWSLFNGPKRVGWWELAIVRCSSRSQVRGIAGGPKCKDLDLDSSGQPVGFPVSSFPNLSVLLTRTGGLGNSAFPVSPPAPARRWERRPPWGGEASSRPRHFISVHFKAPSPRRI